MINTLRIVYIRSVALSLSAGCRFGENAKNTNRKRTPQNWDGSASTDLFLLFSLDFGSGYKILVAAGGSGRCDPFKYFSKMPWNENERLTCAENARHIYRALARHAVPWVQIRVGVQWNLAETQYVFSQWNSSIKHDAWIKQRNRKSTDFGQTFSTHKVPPWDELPCNWNNLIRIAKLAIRLTTQKPNFWMDAFQIVQRNTVRCN